jgi:hypothetical protein
LIAIKENERSNMAFNATPSNMTTLLVCVPAFVALFLLLRGRYDSNMPLLFYSAAFVLTTMTDHSVNSYLLYAGLASAMVLRFEFMGKGFTKFVGFVTGAMIALTILTFLDQVFGDGTILS